MPKPLKGRGSRERTNQQQRQLGQRPLRLVPPRVVNWEHPACVYVTAQQNHQQSLDLMRRIHRRSLAMTQPAALGMTQPRTKNPATNPARPRSPYLRPHPWRHPCAPATEQHPTTARRPHRATLIVSYPLHPSDRAAPDDGTAPSSCDADSIAPLRPSDKAAPDSTAPSSCDVDSIAPRRPSDRAAPDGAAPPRSAALSDATPPYNIAKLTRCMEQGGEDFGTTGYWEEGRVKDETMGCRRKRRRTEIEGKGGGYNVWQASAGRRRELVYNQSVRGRLEGHATTCL